jgi:hypothetical protein
MARAKSCEILAHGRPGLTDACCIRRTALQQPPAASVASMVCACVAPRRNRNLFRCNGGQERSASAGRAVLLPLCDRLRARRRRRRRRTPRRVARSAAPGTALAPHGTGPALAQAVARHWPGTDPALARHWPGPALARHWPRQWPGTGTGPALALAWHWHWPRTSGVHAVAAQRARPRYGAPCSAFRPRAAARGLVLSRSVGIGDPTDPHPRTQAAGMIGSGRVGSASVHRREACPSVGCAPAPTFGSDAQRADCAHTTMICRRDR